MEDKKVILLNQITECLKEYGIESQIRDDRKDGPYINIGDRRHVSKRAQFWIDTKTGSVKFWVGLDMGRMYSTAAHSQYRVKWDTEKTREIHLIFPYLYPAFEFIKMISEP